MKKLHREFYEKNIMFLHEVHWVWKEILFVFISFHVFLNVWKTSVNCFDFIAINCAVKFQEADISKSGHNKMTTSMSSICQMPLEVSVDSNKKWLTNFFDKFQTVVTIVTSHHYIPDNKVQGTR